jgi:hypothetical protein
LTQKSLDIASNYSPWYMIIHYPKLFTFFYKCEIQRVTAIINSSYNILEEDKNQKSYNIIIPILQIH